MLRTAFLISLLSIFTSSASSSDRAVSAHHLSCGSLSDAGNLPMADGIYYSRGNTWQLLSSPLPYRSCHWFCLVGGSFGDPTYDIVLAKEHSRTRFISSRPNLLVVGLDGPKMEVLFVHLDVEKNYRQVVTSGDAAKRNLISPNLTQLKDHIRCAVPSEALDPGEYIVAVRDRTLELDRRATAYDLGIDVPKNGH